MKSIVLLLRLTLQPCRSREGAWIEIGTAGAGLISNNVAPARERGLKSYVNTFLRFFFGRSREGAWIEIIIMMRNARLLQVAPARERGLKSVIAIPSVRRSQSLPRGSVD